ncbi:MAG: WecB/TagA/CpsF family glycosyltransferase [Verrucomicrobiaceae bacterium]|nr:WecB/TagA/CpsF family glycosyltransferase [Verrucomicrobiaceae bacterium]
MIGPTNGSVLGIHVTVTDYESLVPRILQLAATTEVTTVAAANTHLIASARESTQFTEALTSFDIIVPDGMPLVWALQLNGHSITDRVYGPYLMRETIKKSPPDVKHFFFGGTTECLQHLRISAIQLNPHINICGAVSPPFQRWSQEEESRLIDDINTSDAQCIWVALGGVRQENWIAANRHRFKKGVFLAVGDAFVLLAGLRAFAPGWMQRRGLTWLYRLYQEPRRMFKRYVTYNTRFVAAFLAERWRMTWGK